MELCLVRHGIAVNIGEQGVYTDADRMLTQEGMERTAEAARGLSTLGYRADLIVSSPYRRALETAEILREALGVDAPVESCEVLYPHSDPEETVSWLTEWGGKHECILLAGHMPHLSMLASHLLGGTLNLSIPFKKVAACGLAFNGPPRAGEAVLLWHLPPAVLRMVGDA